MECTECGHFFDPSDERAFVSQKRPDLNICPACNIMGVRSTEAWAAYNSCNGIFTCGVEPYRADVEARIASGEYPDCKAVPVRIIRESDERSYIRAWLENERYGLAHSGLPVEQTPLSRGASSEATEGTSSNPSQGER